MSDGLLEWRESQAIWVLWKREKLGSLIYGFSIRRNMQVSSSREVHPI
jgi:hypothetical protein